MICDKGSVIYNTTYAMGCAVAPIIGGFLDDKYGFRTTADIMAFVTLGLAFVFTATNLKSSSPKYQDSTGATKGEYYPESYEEAPLLLPVEDLICDLE